MLSSVIPLYNEASTIYAVLESVSGVNLPDSMEREIVIVDDASTDESCEEVQRFSNNNPTVYLKLIKQHKNYGKGAALRRGVEASKGEFIVIQDADLEYDPNEYRILLQPILEGRADVVYGSRFMGGNPHRILFFWHSIGNKFLTFFSNVFTNLNLTDMETCYKMFRSEVLRGIKLKENRFGFEPEVTAKISRVKGIRIYEVGISYFGRTYEEGKKINWKDGVRALWCILKYNTWAKKRT
jgi:glycosyltransferase involved in cell wall biosynthesis